MDELTREFLIESQEGLDRMERSLTDLEKRPDDNALLAEIFRSVHTIKGTTGFLGYKRLEKLAHAGENLLGLMREGKLHASASIITGLLQLLDGLRSILRAIEADDSEGIGDDAILIQRLSDLQSTPAAESVLTVAAAQAKSRRKTGQSRATRSSTKNKEVPPSQVSSLVDAIPPDPATIEMPAGEFKSSAGLSIDDPSKRARTPAVAAAESTLRVDVALLNRMMNLVGELVLARNQVLQATSSLPGLTLLSRRLDMVTADLREAVMKARMQPVSNVFSKIPRMVRDLSQSLGRRVRLEMEGQETELDKSLLEAIKDPLTHAVRNALDHGIESPGARLAAGKDAEGVLRIRASQEGSHVMIEVADDGAGIAVERVRAKAVERNLISAERARQQSERELLQLIFLPGFSTASTITNVSGRGVGMDVVRTNVEKIGGQVEIDSRQGKGTTLRMRIPLTLAIIPALIVRSVGQSFALPQSALSELVHITSQKASAIEWIENVPLYRLRGSLLPLVFLDRLLVPGASSNSKCGTYIAVLEADGRRFGLVVDGLADPEEIVVKPLNVALKGIGFYSGATVLGTGKLALILDPTAIALRAGIALSNDEPENAVDDISVNATGTSANDYLLVDIAGQRAAIPLCRVLRIEQLPVSRIECVGRSTVINFNGQILPVNDRAGLLAVAQHDPSAEVVVVVCHDADRQVGFAVSHVLDVAAGGELFEAGSNKCTSGFTLLQDRVTELVDLSEVARCSDPMTQSSQFAEALL